MNTLKFFVLVAMFMALAITLSATPSNEETYLEDKEEDIASPESDDIATSYVKDIRRFLSQKKKPKPRAPLTCNKYPRLCHTKGSPGPNCCKKKCVNIKTDRLNCGKCGKKCKYSEICCKGKCVNPRSNKTHCGRCNNKCKKANKCVYGMCGYAWGQKYKY